MSDDQAERFKLAIRDELTPEQAKLVTESLDALQNAAQAFTQLTGLMVKVEVFDPKGAQPEALKMAQNKEGWN